MRLILIAALMFSTSAHAGICDSKYKSDSSITGYSSTGYSSTGTVISGCVSCVVISSGGSQSCKYDPALNLAIKKQLDPLIGNRLTDLSNENDINSIHYSMEQYQSWIDGPAYEGMTPEKCRVDAYKDYFVNLKDRIRTLCAKLRVDRDSKIIEKTLPVLPQF